MPNLSIRRCVTFARLGFLTTAKLRMQHIFPSQHASRRWVYNVSEPRYQWRCSGIYHLWEPECDGNLYHRDHVYRIEYMVEYRQGGYHPAHLEDLLQGGRYLIVDKLDHGLNSLVWLARDRWYVYLQRKLAIPSSARFPELPGMIKRSSDDPDRSLDDLKALQH